MFAKSLATARDNRDFNTLIKAVPYAKLLGMKAITFVMN